MNIKTLIEFSAANGPWQDGDLLVISRQFDRVQGRCLVTGVEDIDAPACTLSTIRMRDGILPRAWLVLALGLIIVHRAIAPMLLGRELSLSESNFVVLPGLASLLFAFDHVSLHYHVTQSSLPAAPKFQFTLTPDIRNKLFFMAFLLPVMIVAENLDAMPKQLGEALFIAMVVLYAGMILYLLRYVGEASQRELGPLELVRATSDAIWLRGASSEFLSELPPYRESVV